MTHLCHEYSGTLATTKQTCAVLRGPVEWKDSPERMTAHCHEHPSGRQPHRTTRAAEEIPGSLGNSSASLKAPTPMSSLPGSQDPAAPSFPQLRLPPQGAESVCVSHGTLSVLVVTKVALITPSEPPNTQRDRPPPKSGVHPWTRPQPLTGRFRSRSHEWSQEGAGSKPPKGRQRGQRPDPCPAGEGSPACPSLAAPRWELAGWPSRGHASCPDPARGHTEGHR